MPENRCHRFLLVFTGFLAFNLMGDFLWSDGRSSETSKDDTPSSSGAAAAAEGADLFLGSYRLQANGSAIDEGSLRMTVSRHRTGIAGIELAGLAMALRGSEKRSSFGSFDPAIVFSGVDIASVGKVTATGASDPKRFRFFGDRSCSLNAVLELLPGGSVKADSALDGGSSAKSKKLGAASTRGGSAGGSLSTGPSSVIGEVSGVDCGLLLDFAVEAVDANAFSRKVVHYTIFANVLTFIQMRVLLLQMSHTEEGPSPARVSVACIGMMALTDAYDSFLHLCLGLQSQYMFNAIAVVSLLKFILFSLLETRYLLTIWRKRLPDIFNQGWDVVRRELSWLYSRFYALLLFGLVLLYHNLDLLDSVALVSHACWVPQIVCDAWNGCKTPLHPIFYAGMSATRLLFMLYLWGCPETIFSDELFPRLPGTPSSQMCTWMVTIHLLQLGMLASQRRWGPRWFVPWICMPWAYNYHRSSRIVPGSDCVICMGEIDAEDGRKVVVTPCNHVFHEPCLEQWMDVKMECPTCRTNLPPIQ